MIGAQEYYILTFETTTDVMAAEKSINEYFSIAIMPVPREISSGCGLAIRFQEPDEATIIEFLKQRQVTGTLYKMTPQRINGKRHVEKLFPVFS